MEAESIICKGKEYIKAMQHLALTSTQRNYAYLVKERTSESF